MRAAFLGFGALLVLFWRRSPRPHSGVLAATAVGLIGVGLFCWVIVTALFPWLDERASLPDPLMALGPLLFVAGFVAALALHLRQHDRPEWAVAPALALVGLVLVGVDLDLLAVTAVLVGAALWPAGARDARPGTGVRRGATPSRRA